MAARATEPSSTITGPRRPWTLTWQRVADGVFRNLSYAEIGKELAAHNGRKEPVSTSTVRSHVAQIAQTLDGLEDMAPRVRLYIFMLKRRIVDPETKA